jgi:hypothetical protein
MLLTVHVSVVPEAHPQFGASTLPEEQVIQVSQDEQVLHLSEQLIQTGLDPSSNYPWAQEHLGLSILFSEQVTQLSALLTQS